MPILPYTASTVKITLQYEVNRMDAAFVKKNINGIFRYFAPNYARVDKTGKVYHKQDDLAGVESMLKYLKKANIRSIIESVTLSNDTAYVTESVDATITLADNANPSKTETITQTDHRSQTWRIINSDWLLETSRSTSNIVMIDKNGVKQEYIDGQPVKH